MPACFNCKRESDTAHYDRVVYNITPLYGPWSGWRMAGRVLVSPDGDRITPERLRGLMFRATNEARRDRARAKSGLQGRNVVCRGPDDWGRECHDDVGHRDRQRKSTSAGHLGNL